MLKRKEKGIKRCQCQQCKVSSEDEEFQEVAKMYLSENLGWKLVVSSQLRIKQYVEKNARTTKAALKGPSASGVTIKGWGSLLLRWAFICIDWSGEGVFVGWGYREFFCAVSVVSARTALVVVLGLFSTSHLISLPSWGDTTDFWPHPLRDFSLC